MKETARKVKSFRIITTKGHILSIDLYILTVTTTILMEIVIVYNLETIAHRAK